MASFPVLITRSTAILGSTKNVDLVSTSFIARFEDGTEKVLNKKSKYAKGLIREIDLLETVLSKDECCLYFRNWENTPILGTFENNYPVAG